MAIDNNPKTKVELDVSIDKKSEKSLKAQLGKIFSIKEGDSKGSGIAKIGATIGKTFTKSGSDMNKIFGMVTKGASKSMIALTGMVAVIKTFADQIARIAGDSKKFISNNSLFTDKSTLDMMQRTGQSAAGAQSTNRALEQLGLSFEDLQSGKYTEAQGKAFEEIRQRELNKLEQISAVAGPMNEALQEAMLAMNLMKSDILDTITYMHAQSQSVVNLVQKIKPFVEKVSAHTQELIKDLSPFVDLVAEIIAVVMEFVELLMIVIGGVIKGIMKVLGPIIQQVMNIVKSIASLFEALAPILDLLMELMLLTIELSPVIKLIGWIIKLIATVVVAIIDGIKWLIGKITDFVSGIVDFINGIVSEMRKFSIMGWKPFENLGTIGNAGDAKTGLLTSASNHNSNTTNNNQQSNTYNYNDNDLLSNEYILINW